MGTATWISIAVVVLLLVLLGLYLWVTYNSLVTLRARVDEAWRDIVTQQERRAELLPNLVDTVQGYASHERTVFQSVTEARTETASASTPTEASTAEVHMQQALKSLFGVAESFPQLLAGPSFLKLQADLADAEDKIQSSRRFYNGGVREFNTKIQVFPNSLFAKRLGFGQREFFEVSDLAAISQPPKVQF